MADKPLVFLIHGMGVHEEGWSSNVQKALAAQAEQYAHFRPDDGGTPLTDLVDFVEVTYDDVFRRALENWQKKNGELLKEVADRDREQAEKAVGWLEGIGETEDNFGWTHAVDVLLWRFSPYFRNTVKSVVAERITAKLIQKTGESEFAYAKASIVSHSLGTAIAHDVLADLAFGRYASAKAPVNGFDPVAFRFESIHSICNVSRILELDSYPVYKSRVCPGPVGDPNSYCKHFFHYHNKLDPFTLPKAFQPDWDVRWFHDKEVSHLHGEDTHSVAHYLLNPKVHVPLLRSLTARFNAVSPSEEVRAVQEFKSVNLSKVKQKREEIEKRINDAKEAMGASVDMIDLIKGIQFFFGGRS